jgi:hypothetical protein
MRIPEFRHHGNPRQPTRDHVIPRSRLPAQPVVIVCKICNGQKSNMTLPEWHERLVKKQDPRADRVKRFMDENPHIQFEIEEANEHPPSTHHHPTQA